MPSDAAAMQVMLSMFKQQHQSMADILARNTYVHMDLISGPPTRIWSSTYTMLCEWCECCIPVVGDEEDHVIPDGWRWIERANDGCDAMCPSCARTEFPEE